MPTKRNSRITDNKYDKLHTYQLPPKSRTLPTRKPPAPTSGRDEPYKPEYRLKKSYIDNQIALAKSRKIKVSVKRRRP